MRTHIVVNMTAMLAVWLALRLRHDQRWFVFAWCGAAAGLAAATRYIGITVGIVPVLVAVGSRVQDRGKETFLQSLRLFDLVPKLALLVVCVVVGMVAADPFLFFDFASAAPHLAVLTPYAATDQFALASLLDLSKLWVISCWLIPYGTLPWLWILFYVSFV